MDITNFIEEIAIDDAKNKYKRRHLNELIEKIDALSKKKNHLYYSESFLKEVWALYKETYKNTRRRLWWSGYFRRNHGKHVRKL